MNKIALFTFIFVLLIGFASSLSIESVNVDTVSPGEEGIIRINVDNDGDDDVDSLSVKLNFPNSNIIPIGSSEEFLNTLDEDEEESFVFRFRVSNTLPAGIYSIGYNITYEEGNEEIEQEGTIGIIVSAEPEIEVVAEAQNPIIGQQGTLNIRIINKGLADARFVSLSVDSKDITFLGEKGEYIGTIDSDEFETASFDIIPNTRRPSLSIRLEYKNFDNLDQQISTSTTLRVYTQEEALNLGLIKRNNTIIYVIAIIIILIMLYIWRRARKRKKEKEG